MKNKLSLITSIVFLVWSVYHFIADVIPYYQSASFNTMSFNLWVNFVFYQSCLALAIYITVCVIKGKINGIFEKLLPIWVFINTILFSFIENNTFSLKLYTSHTSTLASFLNYAVWFCVHFAFIIILICIFTKGSIKEKLYKTAVIIISASFLASFCIDTFGLQAQLFSLPLAYVIILNLFDALIWAIYIAAMLLVNSKNKIIFWCANIITVAYSLYLALMNIISDISLFISVPSYAYSQSIFEVVKGSYIFDRYLLQTLCCITVLVITVCSFKAKKQALTD